MSRPDETVSRLDESKRYASLYFYAAMARLDTLRELIAKIEAEGGVDQAKRPLAEAVEAATELAENLRHSHYALRQAGGHRRGGREP
jgi:hypothetical protein